MTLCVKSARRSEDNAKHSQILPSTPHWNTEYQRTTLSRIAFARAIESAMTVARRGPTDVLISSGSLLGEQ